MTDPRWAERRDRLRRLCHEAGLDGALVVASRRSAVQWFAGYRPGYLSNWAALWVGLQGDSLGVRFPFEVDRAAAVSGLPAVAAQRPADLVPTLARTIGLVTRDLAVDECPPSLVGDLDRRGVAWVDIADPVLHWRASPDTEDLAAARGAAALCDQAFRALREDSAAWENDFAVVGRVEGFARAHGAEQALCLVGFGSGDVVNEARGRARHSDDVISLELTLLHGSVWTQANWTFAPRGVSKQSARARDACLNSRHHLLQALRPGAVASDVAAVGLAVLREAGLDRWVEYDFGHGVGPHTPEFPRLTLDSRDVVPLGQTVAVHVAVRAPGGPTWFVGGPVHVDDHDTHELAPDAVWTGCEERMP